MSPHLADTSYILHPSRAYAPHRLSPTIVFIFHTKLVDVLVWKMVIQSFYNVDACVSELKGGQESNLVCQSFLSSAASNLYNPTPTHLEATQHNSSPLLVGP